jgi:hypothetical protein
LSNACLAHPCVSLHPYQGKGSSTCNNAGDSPVHEVIDVLIACLWVAFWGGVSRGRIVNSSGFRCLEENVDPCERVSGLA